jgi:hypothetical protein
MRADSSAQRSGLEVDERGLEKLKYLNSTFPCLGIIQSNSISGKLKRQQCSQLQKCMSPQSMSCVFQFQGSGCAFQRSQERRITVRVLVAWTHFHSRWRYRYHVVGNSIERSRPIFTFSSRSTEAAHNPLALDLDPIFLVVDILEPPARFPISCALLVSPRSLALSRFHLEALCLMN